MSFNPQRLQLDTAFAHIDKGNYEAAAPVLRRFAEQGDIDAQYQLAFMLEHGLGVKTDLEGAVHWYAKAAEQGDDSAQFNLGLSYAQGEGVPQDYDEAAKWWKRAAKQDNKDAQAALEELAKIRAEES